MSTPIFVADAMLKKLARWLRILGASTEYLDEDDNKILEYLKIHQKSILLTQDVQLNERAKLRGFKSFLVPREIPMEEQIASVFREFGFSVSEFPSKTICPNCNGSLKLVGREEAAGKALPEVVARHEKFWACERCGHVYWEGSHWLKIKKAAERVQELMKPSS